MLNGVLVGFGIMLASLVIPVVHYVAAPLSPFIAGFIGSGVAKIDQDGIIKFGALIALLMFIPVVAVSILKFVVGVEEILKALPEAARSVSLPGACSRTRHVSGKPGGLQQAAIVSTTCAGQVERCAVVN